MTTVYYTSPFVPPELITACGCAPQRLTGICANSSLSQTEGMCAYTEAWLETLLDKAKNEDYAAVFATSCDQMRRSFELFCRHTKMPGFLLNAPATCTPQSQDYYRLELMRLQRFLMSISNKPFNVNQINSMIFNSVENRAMAKQRHLNVALVGEAIPDSIHQATNDLLAAFDVGIVLNATWDIPSSTIGQKPIQNSDPLTILASEYFNKPAIWKKPNTGFYHRLMNELDKRSTNGVILFRYIFCDLWHSGAWELKRRLSIPVLEIDMDGSGQLSASAISRLQAFSEMLLR